MTCRKWVNFWPHPVLPDWLAAQYTLQDSNLAAILQERLNRIDGARTLVLSTLDGVELYSGWLINGLLMKLECDQYQMFI